MNWTGPARSVCCQRRWCPSSIPGGFTGDGLPIGRQLGARPFAEETLFRAAHACEQATNWHTRIAPAAQAKTDRS